MDSSLPTINELCKKKIIDVKSLALIVLLLIGNPLLVYLHAVHGLGTFWGVLIGSLVMNVSFTAWHECAHGNLSQKKELNTFFGYLASLMALYPGYFASRREHLIHHFYEGDAKLDPVYCRIQCKLWEFPLNLIKTFRAHLEQEIYFKNFPYTAQERNLDRLTLAFLFVLCLFSWFKGFFPSLFFCWILPRGIVFLAHAFYICYLPHAKDEGGFQKYRVRQFGPLGRFLTMEQNFHGLHHKWVSIPWHRYSEALKLVDKSNSADLEVI